MAMAMASRSSTKRLVIVVKQPLFTRSVSTFTQQNQRSPFYRKTFSHLFQECSRERALEPGRQAHARIISSGFEPTVFVANCLLKLYINCSHLDTARKVFDRMSQRDIVSWNSLIFGYALSGNMDLARYFFGSMPERDVISWNSMISGYLQNGDCLTPVEIFAEMAKERVAYDETTFAMVLKACSGLANKSGSTVYYRSAPTPIIFVEPPIPSVTSPYWTPIKLNIDSNNCVAQCKEHRRSRSQFSLDSPQLLNFHLGHQLHCIVVKSGFEGDVVAGSAVLDMYAKCKNLDESLRYFHSMPNKNWVSWSAIIAGFVQNDEHIDGLLLFKQMQREGIGVSQSIYASVFRSCASLSDLSLGHQFHGHAMKSDFGADIIVGTAVLDMYAKCDSLLHARKVFDSLPDRNLQSHNALITAYARSDRGLEAFDLFIRLLKSGLGFDDISLSGAFSACAVIKRRFEGAQLHALTSKTRFLCTICVANAVLDMYGKCGFLPEARRVFDEMEARDAVSWNSVITACEQNENENETLSLFVAMLRSRMEPDEFTFGSVLKACAGRRALGYGLEIHARLIKSGFGKDPFVGSSLADVYCKCGSVDEAERVHERMSERTVVSWNAMISGLSSSEQSERAQKLFSRMVRAEHLRPDTFTYATVLDACSNVANVGLGRQIHAHIIKQDMQSDAYIVSTLVDMYSKCGHVQDSVFIFERSLGCDFVTWNAMAGAYAHHGLGREALNIFERMQIARISPNHATFVAVLRACGHIGLVDEALGYFDSMRNEHELEPRLEHYSSMVDILGRSGRVGEALEMIREMPWEADDVIWRTLLSICRMHGNVEVAEEAASALLRLDPQDSSACVLLSNVYADAGMWGRVSEMRRAMRRGGMKKEPGCSWIEMQPEVHVFVAGDKAHPRCREVYASLDLLIGEMRVDVHVEVTRIHDLLLDEEGEGKGEEKGDHTFFGLQM